MTTSTTDPTGPAPRTPGVVDARALPPGGWRAAFSSRSGPPITDGELAVLIVCNLVTTVGLAGDIARHLQHPEALDNDFLSSWHLVLYGGVLAVGLWLGIGAIRRGPAFIGSAMATTLGFVTLSVGGACDAAWHEAFGTEAAVEALVSPPHLVVFAGLMLLLTSPIVVLWRRPDRRLGLIASSAALVSLVSAILVTSLFTGYLSPLAGGLSLQAGYVEPIVGASLQDYDQVRGLGIAVWTAAVLAAGFTVVLARFRPVPLLSAAAMVAIGVPALVMSEGDSATVGFSPVGVPTASTDVTPLMVGFVAAGVVVELCILVLGRPTLGRAGASITGALVGAALWAGTFAALEADDRLVWTEALWGGAITVSALVGAAVAGLVTLTIPRRAVDDDPPAGPANSAGRRPQAGTEATAGRDASHAEPSAVQSSS